MNRMKRLLAVLLALALLIGMAPAAFAAGTSFDDVRQGAWYYDAVQWAVENGITGGTGANTFSPDAACTRGQVVMFLWRANGSPEPNSSVGLFNDVQPADYYYNAVQWAVENGITNGLGDGVFGPDAACTRAQVVVFLYAAAGKPAAAAYDGGFDDVTASDWYSIAVQWAVDNDITGGVGDGRFGPDQTCTRGQIVTFLWKAAQIGGDVPEVTPDVTPEPTPEVTPDVTPEPTDEVVHSAEDAIALLDNQAERYGYENALSELTEKHTTVFEGESYYRLQQNYNGFPVYGRTVVCAVDENGAVMSVTGNVSDVSADVDLTPTVTEEQVEGVLRAYFGEEFDSANEGFLCIYISEDEILPVLAYCIVWGGTEVLIDANTAEMINVKETVYEAKSAVGYANYDKNPENGFPIEEVSSEHYILRDISRGLTVYTFDGLSSEYLGNDFAEYRAIRLDSEDVIFGNDSEELWFQYGKGVQLLLNVSPIYDFFFRKGFVSDLNGVNLYYNDGYEAGENARGGIHNNNYGVVSMGSETGVDCVDVLAHEYTHVVSRELVGWKGTYENGALNEAMSDIFGELYEYAHYGKCDWVHDDGVRNIIAPELSTEGDVRHPAKYMGADWYNGNDNSKYSHINSTVISHGAYLMSTDGGGLLDMDKLGELWYRTMLMMPSDCDFSTCRRLVELAGVNMGLTIEQMECVSRAFDEVGIYPNVKKPDYDVYYLHQNGTLSLYGIDERLCGNYTIEMTMDPDFEDMLTVGNTADAYLCPPVSGAAAVVLGAKWGLYHCKVVDSGNPKKTHEFYVYVTYDPRDMNIEVHTDFGGARVSGEVLKTEVINDVTFKLPIEGATVSVYRQDSGAFVDSTTVEDIEKGFSFALPNGDYTLEASSDGFVAGKTSFTVASEDVELSILLEPNEVSNEAAYGAYVPMVERAVGDANDYFSGSASNKELSQGYLGDLDGDGIDEMLMCYYYNGYPVYSLYDYENETLVKVVERQKLVQAMAGGDLGSAAMVDFDGKPTIMIMDQVGEGGGPGTSQLYNYMFYDYPAMKSKYVLGYWHEWGEEGVAKEKYYVNNTEVSKESFLSELEHCHELELSKWGYDFYKGDPMSLTELLELVRGPIVVKGTVYETKFVDGVKTNVPITNAVIEVGSGETDQIVETVYTDAAGCFEVELPGDIGCFAEITADGYIPKTTSFTVNDEEAEMTITLVPDDYEAVVRDFMDKYNYNDMDANQRNRSRGMLYDLNGDGQDEVILRAMLKNGRIYENTYEVWTIIGEEAKLLLQYHPEMMDGWLYIAKYNGEVYFVAETVMPGSMAASHELYFYDVDDNPYEVGLHLEYWEMYDESEGTYSIDDQDVDGAAFKQLTAQINKVFDLFAEWEGGYDGYPLHAFAEQLAD